MYRTLSLFSSRTAVAIIQQSTEIVQKRSSLPIAGGGARLVLRDNDIAMGRSKLRLTFDSRLHNNVHRTADDNQVLNVVAADEIELPLCIDRGGFDHAEPPCAAPSFRTGTRIAEGPE